MLLTVTWEPCLTVHTHTHTHTHTHACHFQDRQPCLFCLQVPITVATNFLVSRKTARQDTHGESEVLFILWPLNLSLTGRTPKHTVHMNARLRPGLKHQAIRTYVGQCMQSSMHFRLRSFYPQGQKAVNTGFV
jgi:hypothetical protein